MSEPKPEEVSAPVDRLVIGASALGVVALFVLLPL